MEATTGDGERRVRGDGGSVVVVLLLGGKGSGRRGVELLLAAVESSDATDDRRRLITTPDNAPRVQATVLATKHCTFALHHLHDVSTLVLLT